MAIIKCKDCGKEISDQALTCPHCGCPVTISKEIISPKTEDMPNKSGKPLGCIIIFICLVIGALVLLIMMDTIVSSSRKTDFERTTFGIENNYYIYNNDTIAVYLNNSNTGFHSVWTKSQFNEIDLKVMCENLFRNSNLVTIKFTTLKKPGSSEFNYYAELNNGTYNRIKSKEEVEAEKAEAEAIIEAKMREEFDKLLKEADEELKDFYIYSESNQSSVSSK